MSSFSSTYPAIRPTYQIDFSNGKRIPPNATFSRSDSPIDASKAAASAVHFWSNEKHLSSENLLLDSKTGTANWTEAASGSAATPTITANHAASPDGTASQATRVQLNLNGATDTSSNSRYNQAINLPSGDSVTFSVWLKSTDGASSYAIQVYQADGNAAAATVTGSWQKFTTTATAAASAAFGIRVRGGQSPTNADTADVLMWGANVSTTGQTVLNATTTQIHREYAPTLKSVATAGDARFEYDPTDGQSAGILIESSSTNLSRYGSALGSWANPSLSSRVESNVAVAPNGSLEADLFGSSNTTNTYRYVGDYSISIASGTAYTASVYLKAAGHRYAQLSGISTGWATTDYVNYDLQTGTVSAGGSATGTLTDVGNGWFRATATMTANGSVTGSFLLGMVGSLSDARLALFTANEYDGILVWGFQTEASSFASSLVDTGTGSSQLTRAADSLSAVLSDIGYTGGDATVFVESTSSGGDFPGLIGLDDGGSVNCMRVFRNSGSATSTTDFQFNVNDSSGSNQVASVVSGSGAGTKFAMRLAENNAAFTFDGNTPTTDTSCVMPVTTTLDIGSGEGVSQINGTIKRVALYSEALSDQNLQSLTAS